MPDILHNAIHDLVAFFRLRRRREAVERLRKACRS